MQHLRSRPHPQPVNRSASSTQPEPSMLDELKYICKLMFAIVVVLWGLEFLDTVVFHHLLDGLGIRPRTSFGLIGVVMSPLLHGDFYHLASNTVGLLIFGTLVLLWSRREFWLVTLSSLLIGGLGVWLVGETESLHIGASGIIFGYFGYVLTRGWYERKLLSVAISIVIALTFGSMISGAIPGLAGFGISWEGHLFGMIGGILVARRFKAKRELASSQAS